MKEDFLHYLWRYNKFDTTKLQTTENKSVTIINPGDYLQSSGPDFFNAKLIIDSQKWAGNVEIHVKSSDWYLHHHEKDKAYDNVILHVVWNHDARILRKDKTEIPTLQLRDFVEQDAILKYQSLLQPKSWIYCENQINAVDDFLLRKWQERLFFERLERKAAFIDELLLKNHNDWESTLFCLLAKSFGSNSNGQVFFDIAASIPYTVIRKERGNPESMEALLLGMAGLLDEPKEDVYFRTLVRQYQYLKIKYKLMPELSGSIQFFRLRPDNFPTIRLSQLANLLATHPNLFSELSAADSTEELYRIFKVSASHYWQNHYQFDHRSKTRKKVLSKGFVNLLIINTVIPIRFAYLKSLGKESLEKAIQLMESILPEQNGIIDKFKSIGIDAENAFQSQALLQLKNEYCNQSKCLNCAVGLELLKTTNKNVVL